MKNVYIITDNEIVHDYFKSIVGEFKLDKEFKFTYFYSIKNNNPEKLKSKGLTPINLNDQTTITKLISTAHKIFSAHCKQIFPAALVEKVSCINIHPGFNPDNRGWFPQVFAILNGKRAGATIHYMDAEIDHGKIIAQQEIKLNMWDTSFSAYNRILKLENDLLRSNIHDILYKHVSGTSMNEEGNYNSFKDFKELCELDLENCGTLREHINLLRALTHAPYKNAFFYDEDGTKIKVGISLDNVNFK